MTDEVFTASNGIIVTIDNRGYLLAKGGRDGMTTHATAGAHYGVQALREYFQHERGAGMTLEIYEMENKK